MRIKADSIVVLHLARFCNSSFRNGPTSLSVVLPAHQRRYLLFVFLVQRFEYGTLNGTSYGPKIVNTSNGPSCTLYVLLVIAHLTWYSSRSITSTVRRGYVHSSSRSAQSSRETSGAFLASSGIMYPTRTSEGSCLSSKKEKLMLYCVGFDGDRVRVLLE